MKTERGGSDKRIPITLLTGFLGSGKTTILNDLLRHPTFSRTAVIVNEFGEVGLDHLLVARSSDEIIELSNGCLCCTVRSDIVTTLFGLYASRLQDNGSNFERVIIETTGLADPAPILLTLFTDDVVARRYRVEGVVTIADVANGHNTLDHQDEAVKQAAAADLIVLTKLDLTTDAEVQSLQARLRILNPGCPMIEAIHGRVDPAAILSLGSRKFAGSNKNVERWMGLARENVADGHCGSDGHKECHLHHDIIDAGHHHDRVVTHCAIIDTPIPWQSFIQWINSLRCLKGPNLLRVKGLANIADRPGRPLVVHAVQEVFHPPIFLDDWPSDDRRTRLVFILRDIAPSVIEETLQFLKAPIPGEGVKIIEGAQ